MKEMEEFKIESVKPKKDTIYFYLKDSGLSEHYIKSLRKEGSIFLNNRPAKTNDKIKTGDKLEILKSPKTTSVIQKSESPIEVVYEDDDYLIVNKPSNLACIPTKSHFSDNLGARILFNQPDGFVLRVLNRLDKETCGLVAVAKSVISYNKFSAEKEYHALCHNHFEQKDFWIDKPILTVTKNGINDQKRIISQDGKPAQTHVEVIREIGELSLVKLTLKTGRTHQIRVHLSSIGHALFGDTLYGIPNEAEHAYLILKKMTFTHFRTNKKITLEVDYPSDWKALLK